MQENHYCPFGLNQIGDWYATTAPENKYQYNGKELNEELGLNWNNYGARYYDPAIGRFGQIDPMVEERNWLTPYNYVQNQPTNRIDPTGALDHDYGLDVNTGEVTLLRETDDDTHTIYTGTTNNDGNFSKGVNGIVSSITISKGSSNIEEVVDEFGDASAGGLVFSGGQEAYSDGENVMEFISFQSHIELAGWTFDGDDDSSIDGIYINRWDENDAGSSFDDVDLYNSEVRDESFSGKYLGEKIYKVHTHPGTRGGEGGFGTPSRTDMITTRERAKYPHFINSRLDGWVRYYPKPNK